MFRAQLKQTIKATRTAVRHNSHKAHGELPPWALEPAYPQGPNKKAAEEFINHAKAEKEHAEHTSSLWRKISYFIAAPAVIGVAINTYFVEAEHARHREHLAHVPDEEWPVQYDFQNIRTKNFFWGDGDKTLFWNPVVNRHIQD